MIGVEDVDIMLLYVRPLTHHHHHLVITFDTTITTIHHHQPPTTSYHQEPPTTNHRHHPQHHSYKALSAILFLGLAKFEPSADGESSSVADPVQIEQVGRGIIMG